MSTTTSSTSSLFVKDDAEDESVPVESYPFAGKIWYIKEDQEVVKARYVVSVQSYLSFKYCFILLNDL